MYPRSVQEFLHRRIPLIFDGAMGTELQKCGFGPGDADGHPECNEIYNVTRPEAVAALHKRYFDAGAVVVETNTIGANRVKLEAYGWGGRVREINLSAVRVARSAAGEGAPPRFVCGAMGPTGLVPGQGRALLFNELVEVYREQAAALLDGGVDMLLLETQQVLLEVRAGIIGVRRAMAAIGRRVPLAVQATFDEHGRMLLGADPKAFLGAVANLCPDIVGANCGTGPEEMQRVAEALATAWPHVVSIQPNAGMPENADGRAVYRMSPDEFGCLVAPLVLDRGVAVVGGCCGTTPEHIRALAERLAGGRVAARTGPRRYCFLGSGLAGVDLESGTAPLIIGERLNAQGSRRTKELLLAGDFDELCHIALEQVRRGAVALDLCVAVNEAADSEAHTMTALVSYLAERVEAGFCIDTTEPSVLEHALRVAPGAVLINSINLEHGGEKACRVLDLAREFGAAVIGLTIDDQGMARTADRKLAVARQLADLVCGRYGLPEHRLYVDPLVFTLATGERDTADAAVQSLEALRRIRIELPGVRTLMGVSNVSFGLQPAARRVLNNLMLHHAVEAGLRAAIYNPSHLDDVAAYDPRPRELGEDLLFNRRPDALAAFVQYFEQTSAPGVRAGETEAIGGRNDTTVLTPQQELRRRILSRDRRDLARLVEQALSSVPPEKLLNEVLIPAMAEVGELMAAGKMILPFVLQAAEVMREAVALVEPHLDRTRRAVRGKIVLATVFGDVHDIGKNLVGSILRNQGFEVIDLGRQVPSETIVEAAVRERPVAVGLSALLVTTSREMAVVVAGLAGAGLSIPVLIGGAAVNRPYAERIAILADGSRYAGGVYYCKDAFEATRLLEHPEQVISAPVSPSSTQCSPSYSPVGSFEFLEPAEHGEPPFYGTSQVLVWGAEQLLEEVRQERLFRGYWRGGSLSEQEYARAAREQFGPAWRRVREVMCKPGVLDPRGLYGFFPVITDGELVIVLNPGDFHTELASFRFPRVARANNRSVADYFRPEGDIIAVQAVTLGPGVSVLARSLFQEKDEYSMGFYLNGAANLLTENLAERLTREIRRGLALDRDRGRRYSFGYPGLPGVEEQRPLCELLGVEHRLGVTLTPGFQMDPEHSTVGIFVHHPKAAYL